MKIFFSAIIVLIFTQLTSCNIFSGDQPANADAVRADSLWKVAIADSINRARGISTAPQVKSTDTASGDIESITRGMTEGLNKVQEGLNKVKRVTEVSANSAKAISEGINKTKEAVNKTVEEAKKTIKGQ